VELFKGRSSIRLPVVVKCPDFTLKEVQLRLVLTLNTARAKEQHIQTPGSVVGNREDELRHFRVLEPLLGQDIEERMWSHRGKCC
jgi:hypothetical protein